MSEPNRLDILRHALATLRDEAEPPAHLVAAALALHGAALAPPAELFALRAAASPEEHQALVCTSRSGLWTLEIFVGQSPEDQAAGRGQLLLGVHPDHRPTYEGRTARIFIASDDGKGEGGGKGGGERVLAEAVVRNGELYADIMLTGLDLHRRDAVNVVFGPVVSP